MLRKISAYVKIYDGQIEWMCFLILGDDLLQKHDVIKDKVHNNEPVCNEEYLKVKIKSHGYEVTNFYKKEIPKVDPFCGTSLAVISLESVLKKDENCYPQVFLKECKYINKKVFRDIIDDSESYFNVSDDSDHSDEK